MTNRPYTRFDNSSAGGPPPLESVPFRLRTQTSADLGAARWGLLAWEDPAVGMAASSFWVDAEVPRGRFEEPDDSDPTPILVLLQEAGATLSRRRLWGLRRRRTARRRGASGRTSGHPCGR